MGLWNLYFIGKLALHVTGSITLNPWLNPGLVAALLVPLPEQPQRLRVARQLAATGAAVALLYYESYLPPWRSLLVDAGALSGFSVEYLAELLSRIVDLQLGLALLALAAAYVLLARWLRLSVLVLLALLIVPFVPQPRSGTNATANRAPAAASVVSTATDDARLTASTSPADLDRAVERFFGEEVRKTLPFPQVTHPVDLILIHVCSLAWSDLRAIGQERHPLFSGFDVLFTNFNTAASYSGPAAIRLLRGTCGQGRHDGLYDPAAPDCRLMARLQHAGFEPQWLMNHDGRFGDFRQDLTQRGGLEAEPLGTAGARVAMQSFDGTAILEDHEVLRDWWTRRSSAKEPRIALYYNSISLHDGNRVPGRAVKWTEDYPRRAQHLLDDIERFMDDLDASGARAIVVFIPEHGAAFHAARGQIAGLRHVPVADITHVPVGVRLVGVPLTAAQRPLRVQASTSYLGLNQFLARVMAALETNAERIELAPLAVGLHTTAFVAEHDGLTVVRAGDGYFMRGPDGQWTH